MSSMITSITPTDLRIYYEDSTPYLDYKGTAVMGYDKVEVHIPKMKLNIDLSWDYDVYLNIDPTMPVANMECRCGAHSKEFFTIKVLEKDMIKDQIEKALGYKVNIVEK